MTDYDNSKQELYRLADEADRRLRELQTGLDLASLAIHGTAELAENGIRMPGMSEKIDESERALDGLEARIGVCKTKAEALLAKADALAAGMDESRKSIDEAYATLTSFYKDSAAFHQGQADLYRELLARAPERSDEYNLIIAKEMETAARYARLAEENTTEPSTEDK